MAAQRSPIVRIYRRVSTRLGPLRELLERHDFHAVSPPDAMAEWECRHDDGTRVRGAGGMVIVECADVRSADEFDARHRRALPSDGEIPDGGAAPERVEVIAGSDEAGKSESDRALVVAAVAVPVEGEGEMLERGVRDSKTCSAAEVEKMSRWIRERCAHAVEIVEVGDRRRALREHGGNESRLLAAMHVGVLVALHGRERFGVARVDRFAPGRPVARGLEGRLVGVVVDECARGERHVACAAASIVARSLTGG